MDQEIGIAKLFLHTDNDLFRFQPYKAIPNEETLLRNQRVIDRLRPRIRECNMYAIERESIIVPMTY